MVVSARPFQCATCVTYVYRVFSCLPIPFNWIITRNAFTTYQGPIKLTLSALDKCCSSWPPLHYILFPQQIVLTVSRLFFKAGELNKKALCQINLPICLTAVLFPFPSLLSNSCHFFSFSCHFLLLRTSSPVRFIPYCSFMKAVL